MPDVHKIVEAHKPAGWDADEIELYAEAIAAKLCPLRREGPTVAIPESELESLRLVVAAAEELVDAICGCQDIHLAGCEFEHPFTQLRAALSKLPRYYEAGRYLWQEIDRDFRHDALGG